MLISLVLLYLCLFQLLQVFFWLFNTNQKFLIGYCFPVFLVVFGAFLYMPYKVGYNNKSIYIRRIKGKVEIPLDSILSINSITPNILQNSVRVFGSGGFLGNIGYFKNEKLGTYIMYTTSTEKLVCIKTTTKTYVINCPDDVLRRVQENKKKDPCSRRNLSKISGCSK